MLSKLLGNKIILILIIALAAVAVIAISNLGGGDSIETEYVSDNPNYLDLIKEVEQYKETTKWNRKAVYNSIKNNIDEYYSDELIDILEKDQIVENLIISNLFLLNDIIKNFLKSVDVFK